MKLVVGWSLYFGLLQLLLAIIVMMDCGIFGLGFRLGSSATTRAVGSRRRLVTGGIYYSGRSTAFCCSNGHSGRQVETQRLQFHRQLRRDRPWLHPAAAAGESVISKPHIRDCRSSSSSSKLYSYDSSGRHEGTSNCGGSIRSAALVRLVIPTADDMEEIGALLASITLLLESPSTSSRAADASAANAAGQVIFLKGDLGAGKTAFARGFLRAATGDWQLRVTSPTYLLSNTYLASDAAAQGSNQNLEIHHMDLYRLSGKQAQVFSPLNLDHVFANCLSLIEWPIRLPETLVPCERLEITITIAADTTTVGEDDYSDGNNKARMLTFAPIGGAWEQRIRTILGEGYVDDLLLDDDV